MIPDLHSVRLVNHPLVQHKITMMREHACKAREFGHLLRDCGLLLGYEATRTLKTTEKAITTPRGVMGDAITIAEADPVVVAVMRAGLTMAEGLRDIFHVSSMGHIGLSRHGEDSHGILRYYSNLPIYVGQRYFIVDPVIATGRTISMAVDIVKEGGARDQDITVIALIAAEFGIREFVKHYHNISVFLGACDPDLDKHQFVVPGVGDMGDRLFGTA